MEHKETLGNPLFRKSDEIFRETDADVIDVSKVDQHGVSSKVGRDSINGVSHKKPESLSEACPAIFAPGKRKAKIDPRDFLNNPLKAFVLAEILRPLD